MSWSTQQLADLAGTTVKAIRHYHRIGLLDEPERSAGGYYKRYEVLHLIRLLQIRRLVDLGVSLSSIEALGPLGEDPEQTIGNLDSELAATVERLNRIRSELAVIMQHRGATYVPIEFAPLSADFTERQRALLMIYSTVLSEESLAHLREQLRHTSPTDAEFEELPADADPATIEDLADRMLPDLRAARARYPRSLDPTADSPRGSVHAQRTMAEALVALYNPAQLALLQRLDRLLSTNPDESDR